MAPAAKMAPEIDDYHGLIWGADYSSRKAG
jgi:hypothetical protein